MNHDDRFDAALRARHRDAIGQVSPRVQAQLQQRLRATLAPARARARHPAWGVAVACSLALAVAFGMRWNATSDTPTTAPSLTGSGDNGELVATLDEAPDLYVWLASDDANDILSE